ncbi:MAG: CRTAC1 family protein [Planctomycetota bacterium]|nr:MAG: CRTAC1 family protein [Planctomycetota bacterium]
MANSNGSHAGSLSRVRPFLLPLVALLALASPAATWAETPGAGSVSLRFQDVTEATGIDFVHYSGRSGHRFIYETISTGLVTLDYDNDGWVDVYCPNGCPMVADARGASMGNRLYRNLGGWRFADVTDAAGAGDDGFALGATAGDFDNDGDQDLLIANYGPSVLLENNGDGTFDRRPLDTGRAPNGARRMSTGVAMLDYDGDGMLDFYLANYIQFDPNRGGQRLVFGVPAAPGPKDYVPDHDLLLRNDGQGGVLDVSRSCGIADYFGAGMGVVAFDFDDDGDVDVFVCNDSAPNFLFENEGDGRFAEIALLAGVAYDVTGAQQATMGADVGDWDNDGWLDLVTTNFSQETPTLYEYSGDGFFDDIGPVAGLGDAHPRVTWGVVLADFDHDSQLDVYLGAGHLFDIVAELNTADQFAVPNYVFHQRNGRWVDVSQSIPAVGTVHQVTRGVCGEDFDRDGDIDLICLNFDGPVQVLENVSTVRGQSIELLLVGRKANRDAVGAHIITTDEAGGSRRFTVVSGRGYQSDFGRYLHITTPSASVPEVTIRWPKGNQQRVSNLSAGRVWAVIEGEPEAIDLGRFQAD